MDDKVNLIYKILIALAGGVFGVAIAITAQHIKLFRVPRVIFIAAVCVQVVLSLGIFLGVMLVFKSSFLPQIVPNDDWSALTAAYLLSSIPHIVVATALTIYDKEINKWLQERYGDSCEIPSMKNYDPHEPGEPSEPHKPHEPGEKAPQAIESTRAGDEK